MPSVWRQLLLAGVLSLTLFGPAFALGASIRISDPLPEELRKRIADLMRSRRPGDADAALAATKIEIGPIWREKRILLLRVETDCRDDFCMVIIGRVTDQAIIPEVTLRAYPTVLMGQGRPILGFFWSAHRISRSRWLGTSGLLGSQRVARRGLCYVFCASPGETETCSAAASATC